MNLGRLETLFWLAGGAEGGWWLLGRYPLTDGDGALVVGRAIVALAYILAVLFMVCRSWLRE